MIGFEERSYTVGEGDGVAEICVVIQSPADLATLPSSYSAPINISTVPGSAQCRPPIKRTYRIIPIAILLFFFQSQMTSFFNLGHLF